jgi:hypothetical protein
MIPLSNELVPFKDGVLGDFGSIPEAEILTEEDLMKMNLDPSQFERVR